MISNIWSFVASVSILILGILGISYSGKPEKANAIIIMGIVLIGVIMTTLVMNLVVYIPQATSIDYSSYYPFDSTGILADTVASAVSGTIYTSVILGAMYGLVLSILYITGGSRLKTYKIW